MCSVPLKICIECQLQKIGSSIKLYKGPLLILGVDRSLLDSTVNNSKNSNIADENVRSDFTQRVFSDNEIVVLEALKLNYLRWKPIGIIDANAKKGN